GIASTRSSRRPLTLPRPRASTPPAGDWSPTWGPTPARAFHTCTSISWEAAPWGGRRADGPDDASPGGLMSATPTTQVKILVPGTQSMLALVGQRAELLRAIESA